MTDVLITKNIAGHKRGAIVPLTPRLEQHVKAGNAKVLPNAHDAWSGEPAREQAPAPVAQVIGNVDPAPWEQDADDATADEDEATGEELD